jgi:hypothetical protein
LIWLLYGLTVSLKRVLACKDLIFCACQLILILRNGFAFNW